ncbi:Glu/Leu/Phe/Val family dehydrogenase [Novosphingopyxis sp.]|uniref:Glu/Leu/Phe/Val family dehydrogenase n=1 Tax=Novosphingopyxis sp. TaxID=2709690 RepID=UPI003B5B3F1D
MPSLWSHPDYDAHETVHYAHDIGSGLSAIIAVHSTHLGPGTGGTRFWHYVDKNDALTDVLRLSRGMSYKNAMAGLPLGGGKGVILAGEARAKTPAMLSAYGQAIDALGGRYVTAEDVGITTADMVQVARQTNYVSGLPQSDASEAGGDPGPFTARGIYLGVRAAVRHKLGRSSMDGVRVAIQGVGSVGGGLARLLAADGAKLTIADIDRDKAAELAAETGAVQASLSDIMRVEADVFSPNALGAILDEVSIANLNVAVVAGGANNQLARPDDAQRLFDRGILYAPDYVINAGGVINIGLEYLGESSAEEVNARIDNIPGRLEAIWRRSEAEGVPSANVADRMARELIGR